MWAEAEPYRDEALPCLGWPKEIQNECQTELKAVLLRHGCDPDYGQSQARLDLKLCLIKWGHGTDMDSFDRTSQDSVSPTIWIEMQHLRNDYAIGLLLRLYALRNQSARKRQRAMEPAVLKSFPAWEITPWDASEKPAILERWILAGGKCYGENQRMAAVKTSEVWGRMDALTPPERPSEGLPPFVFGWQCQWTSLSWADAFVLNLDPEGISSLMRPRTEESLAKAASLVARYDAMLAAALAPSVAAAPLEAAKRTEQK